MSHLIPFAIEADGHSLQTVLGAVPVTVTSPKLLPQIETGLWVMPVNLVAPGIMTQS